MKADSDSSDALLSDGSGKNNFVISNPSYYFHKRQPVWKEYLALLLGLLLNISNLLSLLAWRRDLHTEDDVSHFRLRQRRYVHIVLLAIISEYHVFQSQFNLQTTE